MTENIAARDLMFRTFTEVRADQTLGEAMRALVEAGADAAVPNVLAVVDDGGRFEGLLTARLILKSLLTLWMPSKALREDEMQLEEELLSLVEERSGMRFALCRMRRNIIVGVSAGCGMPGFSGQPLRFCFCSATLNV